MKIKIILSILALGLIVSTFSQKATIELTFTAENNGQYVPLDSILIENLTQGGDTILYAPDTVLILDYVTNISNNEAIGENTFSVSQNYPNPFKGETKINLYLPESDDIKITVRDILGRELAYYENNLKQGNHTFSFYPGNEKYYLLTVAGKQTSKTIKMLNANSNTIYEKKCKIVYCEYEDNVIGFKSQQGINNFGFNLGDELMFTAYTLTTIGNLGSSVIVDIPEMSKIYEFYILGGLRCPGMSTVTDIDSNVYNTVQIGTQCWMKEDLKTTTYRNGTPIPNVTDTIAWSNLSTGAYAWYDNDIGWKDLYGAFYNGFAVFDTNGLCPSGWHIPTDLEWYDLANFIGGMSSPHGNLLKSCRQVNSQMGGYCSTSEHPRWGEDNTVYGTDDFGFSGLPNGLRWYDGPFSGMGEFGGWQSSTPYSSNASWHWYLEVNTSTVNRIWGIENFGVAARCLKD